MSVITHKATPLVAAVAAAAVAAAVAVAVAVAVAAAMAVPPTDLMCFRPRYLNFLDCSFHYSLEIILRNLHN